MRPMETVQDLIQEAKVRTVWWAICIFAISYFLTHTSKSMWTNIPMSILILSALRYLSYHIEFRWITRPNPNPRPRYLSRLSKRQLSVTDRQLSNFSPNSKWRRKIDSPSIEAALETLIDKILKDFVVDLWYSEITPDKEGPQIIRGLLLDVLGEVSRRVKEMNLVDLLTRDLVDLIGNQLELYRRNQTEIGVNVMITLSSEERDEKLKQHLIASKDLHPALLSPQQEQKVLQQMVEGLLAIVLKPEESQSQLVRCISRELLTCLVLQPLMNLASPNYINELIEQMFLTNKENTTKGGTGSSNNRSNNPSQSMELALTNVQPSVTVTDVRALPRRADWATALDVTTKRRTQVLEPENLENMWTKGRHYQKKGENLMKKSSGSAGNYSKVTTGDNFNERITSMDDKYMVNLMCNNSNSNTSCTKGQIKRSSSTPDIGTGTEFVNKDGGNSISSIESSKKDVEQSNVIGSQSEGTLHVPKIRCRVVGAYFERLGSKSFAVYSIAITDADNKTWFVKRRYSNFERLHRQLKEIPNYTLHLPPKKFLSSSTDDYLVHQRCILLDKYLQELLSIANIAEQHEVWDFLSASSKSYSYGKSTSVMKTLAVNVDDAMDDIVRQFKGVSDGLMRIVGTPPPSDASSVHTTPPETLAMTWHEGQTSVRDPLFRTSSDKPISRSLSDDESNYPVDRQLAVNETAATGWHSDNETNSNKGLIKLDHSSRTFSSPDSFRMPPEWTPPNVSVPLLNLVDKIFQLKRRGWLRRQVLWISKQILQLVMEDAIDDWILRQINLLRDGNFIAKSILWVQDVLWPNGTFFTRVEGYQSNMTGERQIRHFNKKQAESASQLFESQLEASRRANDVKKLLLGGAPAALVSLIGQNAYRRCARDIYYFLQSSVCVKQLAYSMLELVIVSVFPELRQLISDIHEKARYDI